MFWRIGAGLISGSLLASLALLRENTLPELEIYKEIQFLEMGVEHFFILRWSICDGKLFWKTHYNILTSFLRAECFLGMVNSMGLASVLLQ